MARGDVRIGVTLACEEWQAAQLPDQQVQAQRPGGASRCASTAKWCRGSHQPQGDPLVRVGLTGGPKTVSRARDRKARDENQPGENHPGDIHHENAPGRTRARGRRRRVRRRHHRGAAGGENAEVDEAELESQAVGSAPSRDVADETRGRITSTRCRGASVPRAGPKPGGNRVLNFLRASWAELQRRPVGPTAARSRAGHRGGARLRRPSPAPTSALPTPPRRRSSTTSSRRAPCSAGTSSTPTQAMRKRSNRNLEHRVSSLGQQRAPCARSSCPRRPPPSSRTARRRTVERSGPCRATSWSTWTSTTTRGVRRQEHARRHRVRGGLEGLAAGAADAGRGGPPAAQGGRRPRAHPGAVHDRRERQGRVRPRCRTSAARSPRSTRTRPASRSWVSIFGRETPVEVGFDQVKKL